LLVFERKVPRTICGPNIENGVYRRRYNHEFDKEFDSPNVLNVTETSRLRYAGHMIRRPEDLPQKALFRESKHINSTTKIALFRAKHNGRRNQGRPKSRWADGVNNQINFRQFMDIKIKIIQRHFAVYFKIIRLMFT
jgi:hypothetical protein